ncbi:type II toxin-antitoxin system VapC family toxin [Candidatus Woesearchaeota archaeon]|nr:type II toxin-antitoxin system VapC family toxin [Candidatus Woesearchaeota archaeon]
MVMKYLDTYILCEIALGNPKFKHYENEVFIINDLTLAEFYGVLARDASLSVAEQWLMKLKSSSTPVRLSSLLKAALFKNQLKHRHLSFFDAIGYIYAQEQGILFVTGDKEFKNLPGVEFVPK